jgi:hypothetical protein
MAVDTFLAYVGVYPDVADAEADYQLVKDLHTEAGLIDAYDAAVVERRDDGKVRIARKHETPTGSAASSRRGRAGHRPGCGSLPVRRDRGRAAGRHRRHRGRRQGRRRLRSRLVSAGRRGCASGRR